MADVEPTTEQTPEIKRKPDGTFDVGNTGGPGRPKGSFSIMTLIRKKMEEIPPGQTKLWKEQIAEILLDEAITKRNMKAIEMIVEYMDGKPKQNIEIDANKESVDTLTDLLREIGKPKEKEIADGSNTPPPPAPDAGPGSLAGGPQS